MRICEGCQRHVREASCPFCGAASHVVARPKARMSRASLIGAAAVALACGSTTQPQDDAGSKDSGSDAMQPAYGGPFDSGALDTGPDSIQGAYGGPPVDAGDGG